jgi:deazaflavin-dependent oxidoreductase (nitroreductase family)
MLMRIERGDSFVVCGSNGGNESTPNWYRNLQAAGVAEVEVKGKRIPVAFREVAGADERAECWNLLTAGYPDFATYQELTDRQLPIGVLEPG